MLKDVLGINKNDVISIVGAGGKTTMLFKLAKELNGKVCITTSTKIFMPDKSQYDYIYNEYPKEVHLGRTLIAGEINSDNKLTAISEMNLDKCCDDFDYVLIEADGAKCKSLKAWNESEPVVFNNTTKTVCVLDISVVGKEFNSENIFRIDEFRKLIKSDSDNITTKQLSEMILHSDGITKNSLGEKILYINKVESDDGLGNALKLVDLLLTPDNKMFDKVVIGSLFEGKYYLMYNRNSISASILAAGKSVRMGCNKLELDFRGKKLIEYATDLILEFHFDQKQLITNNESLTFKGINSIYNSKYELGQSESIKLAVKNDMDAYLFLVADQPFIKRETILKIISKYNETGKIIMCKSSEHIGNPSLIPCRYKSEIMKLNGDVGAKAVIKKHLDDIIYVDVADEELTDIDTVEEYNSFLMEDQ